MYQQRSSKQSASLPPQPREPEIQHKKVENEKGGRSSTRVKRERTTANYFNQPPTPPHTPKKLHAHPPGWERITWAPKVPSSYPKQRASVSPQRAEQENQPPVKKEHPSVSCFNQPPTPPYTPKKRHAHPPGWDKITWAPKVCRKAVRRFGFGEIATAAH